MAAPLPEAEQPAPVCPAQFAKARAMGCARRVGGGHYRLHLRNGEEYETHGPDVVTAEDVTDIKLLAADPPRQPVCSNDYRQVFLYVYQAGSANNLATAKPTILTAAKGMDSLLNKDSLASGNMTADYKVKCDTAAEISVQSFSTTATDFAGVMSAAKAAGFTSTFEKYTMFADFAGDGYSGIGTFYDDTTLAASNRSNVGPSYAMSMKNYWTSRSPMHENGHTMGAVQADAPQSSGSGGHCNDGQDVMCYADGGDKSAYRDDVCTDRIYFDCNHDSYFDSYPEAGQYLKTHWNIGANTSWTTFNNNFIAFGKPGVTPAPTPTPPATSSLPGDVNGDKRVNAIDLSALISHDGQNYSAADFNRDGAVGAADMAILLSKWTW